MKKIIATAIIVSLMGMVTIPAMASPQQHPAHSQQTKQHPSHPQYKQKTASKKIQSHQNWKNGQVLSKPYRGKAYWADAKAQRHLPKAGKNQRWIKIDQDYILINTLSNVILSVLLR